MTWYGEGKKMRKVSYNVQAEQQTSNVTPWDFAYESSSSLLLLAPTLGNMSSLLIRINRNQIYNLLRTSTHSSMWVRSSLIFSLRLTHILYLHARKLGIDSSPDFSLSFCNISHFLPDIKYFSVMIYCSLLHSRVHSACLASALLFYPSVTGCFSLQNSA